MIDHVYEAAVREVEQLRAQLTAALQEQERLKKENERLEQWADLVTRGKSPCGHWSAYAVTQDGGKHITCLQCGAEDAAAQITAVVHEMRTMARVAGQASVEEIDLDRAGANARLAEIATRWADLLTAPARQETRRDEGRKEE